MRAWHLPNDQTEHGRAAGAEREAHAHFLRTLRDRERQYAIDADAGQKKRGGTKDALHVAEDAELPEALAPQVFHRAHVEDRQTRVRSTNFASDRGRQRRAGLLLAARIVSPTLAKPAKR
jgi:hypothetical protein